MEFTFDTALVIGGVTVYPDWCYPDLPLGFVKETIALEGSSTSAFSLQGIADQDE